MSRRSVLWVKRTIRIGQVWRHRDGSWIYIRQVHRKDQLANVTFVKGDDVRIGTVSFWLMTGEYIYDPVATEIKQIAVTLGAED